MKNLHFITLFVALYFCALPLIAQTVHTEFKAKNFPSSQKAAFTKAAAAYKDGEKQYKLLIKDNNTSLIPTVVSSFKTAYQFNPNHIALNRYLANLMFLEGKKAEAFPYLEKLYDLKADLSPDELFMLASLLQIKGSFTRAEIIFKRFQDAHGDGAFWSEGRLQSPSKRIEECIQGNKVATEPVHFKTNATFLSQSPNSEGSLFYNHFYGWWNYSNGINTLLSKDNGKNLSNIFKNYGLGVYSDLNAQVFITGELNEKSLLQLKGEKQLELDKLADNFQVKTPYISNDLRRIYFSSNRPNGYGGDDIWIAYFDGNGKFVSVKNAGPTVNDQYDQQSPTFSADERFFFVSSNGKGSTGGFDMLYAKHIADSIYPLKNLGFPVNSGHDEKYIQWDITGTKGFIQRVVFDSLQLIPFRETGSAKEALFIGTGFSSATIGPLSSSRYEAGVDESFISNVCKLHIKLNKANAIPAEIEIYNLQTGETFLQQKIADTVTTLHYLLPSQYNYGILVYSEGQTPGSAFLNLRTDEIFLERTLSIRLKPIKKGTSFMLENIFFSKDYIEMESKSLFEIERISAWLKAHPKVKVEIAVHTDELSMHSTVIAAGESAAFQIYEEFKRLGIEKKRLDWMFYGPDKPIYTGKDVNELAKNRRIELLITDK